MFINGKIFLPQTFGNPDFQRGCKQKQNRLIDLQAAPSSVR